MRPAESSLFTLKTVLKFSHQEGERLQTHRFMAFSHAIFFIFYFFKVRTNHFFGFENYSGIFGTIVNLFKVLTGPKYNGKYLHNLLKKELGDKRLHQTLTNVVIPTFDIKKLQPTIFSSYQVLLL